MNSLDRYLSQISTAAEWGMSSLLILAAGLEVTGSWKQAIIHFGLAILLCPKTPTSAPTKFLVAIVAFVSTFL
jgi:hypothetical protein